MNEATKSSYNGSATMNLLPALQAWPVLLSRAPTAACTVESRSAVLSKMNGSEPPSSSTTFFRLRPAISATAAPARSDPVRDAPNTSIGNDLFYLLIGCVYVDIRSVRVSGIVKQLIKDSGGLGTLGRMFQEHGVTGNQVGSGEPRNLIAGKVPWHYPKKRADRHATNEGRSLSIC